MSRAAWKERGGWALRALAALYLVVMWLEGPGWVGPFKNLPNAFLFFTQCTALFPHAARASIEYRAEAYVCDASEWREIDTRPYFPIDRENKENRFQRAMFFYRQSKRTMVALDRYLTDRHNDHVVDDGDAKDEAIGGVRLFSIRTPLPEVGGAITRVHRRDLVTIPKSWRKVFYETRSATVTERCFGTHPRERPDAPEPDERRKDDPAEGDPSRESP